MDRYLMRLAAGLGWLISAALLSGCAERNVPVEWSATDDGAWTIDDAKDWTVAPGDDFFAYCNGAWVAQAEYDTISPDINSFYYTEMPWLTERRLTPEMDALMLKLGADIRAAAGRNVERTDSIVQKAIDVLNAATTREELWEAMATLGMQGYQMPVAVMALPKAGRMCGLVMMNSYELTPMEATEEARKATAKATGRRALLGNGRVSGNDLLGNWLGRLRDPGFAARLVPIVGGETIPADAPARSLSRGALTPDMEMLCRFCEVQGLDPRDVYISPDDFGIDGESGDSLEIMWRLVQTAEPDALRSLLKGYVENDRRLYAPTVMYEMLFSLLGGVVKRYVNYDVSARFGMAFVTEEMCRQGRDLCERLRRTFRKRLMANTWLSEASKTQALKKLDAMLMFVGRPDEFFEEGMADISRMESLVEDMLAIRSAYFALQRRLVGMTAEEGLFHVNISTYGCLTDCNANYLPNNNALFIYPVWMMPPVYVEGANSACNLAAVSSVIAHEITHGFDVEGCRRNEYGELGSIWTSDADAQAFERKANALIDWYSSFEVLPGLFSNGEKTVSEDIADLGGLEIAFQAYTDYLTDNGFRGEGLRLQQRRFFEAYAYFWRAKYTDEYAARNVTGSERHSLPRERVNAVVPNIDAWYDLFDVKPGDRLYRAPEDRTHIW